MVKFKGKVVKVEYLRGGISVIVDPVGEEVADDPYFQHRPRGTFELLGLSKEAGKSFKAGSEVSISVEVVESVEVEPAGAGVDLTEGDEDTGPQDEASED